MRRRSPHDGLRFLRQAGGLLARPLAIAAAMLLLFTAGRIALAAIHRVDFAPIAAAEYPRVFLRGLVFDAAAVLTAAGLPLLMMVLFPDRPGARWAALRRPWPWVAYAVFVLLLFVIAVDIVYFGHVHRHLGAEVALVGENFADTLEFAVTRHGGAAAGCTLAAAAAGILWRRLLRATRPPAAGRPATAAAALLALLLIFGGQRGGFFGGRIEIADAYPGLSPPGALLALNGPFTAASHLLSSGLSPSAFLPPEEALETVRKAVLSPVESVPDPTFPLYRRRSPAPGPRPNVVVVLLESWSSAAVDVCRQAEGLPPLGVTPAFDALSRRGVLFTRFYACGQRTRNALGAVMNGIPALPTLPYIGKGLEDLPISYLGRLGRAEGYATHFFHPEKTADEKRYVTAAAAGFAHRVSSEEVPREGERFWDADLYREAANRLAQAARPYLAVVMSAVPHAPYRRPEGPWNRFPDDGVQKAYWNALGYADWALGDFFSRMAVLPDFDRTIFIVLSDHVERIEAESGDPLRLFRIPALVIASGMPAGVSEEVGSQIDVIPTIAHLAGWGAAHASLGRSLFDRRGRPPVGALLKYSESLIRVEAEGWVHHSLRGRIDGRSLGSGADLAAIERRLLATVQTATRLYRTGRLAPAD